MTFFEVEPEDKDKEDKAKAKEFALRMQERLRQRKRARAPQYAEACEKGDDPERPFCVKHQCPWPAGDAEQCPFIYALMATAHFANDHGQGTAALVIAAFGAYLLALDMDHE